MILGAPRSSSGHFTRRCRALQVFRAQPLKKRQDLRLRCRKYVQNLCTSWHDDPPIDHSVTQLCSSGHLVCEKSSCARFRSIACEPEQNFSHLALLYLQSAPIPRKGERPSLNLGDDTNFSAQFECAPPSSIIRRGVTHSLAVFPFLAQLPRY